jgi:hypothetical protein
LSHTNHASARPFVVTPYISDAGGVLKPVLPNECPWRRPGDRPCKLLSKNSRKRKTGPKSLTQLKCNTHDEHFTLYPPGYAPYQRVPVARLAPDGTWIRDESGNAPRGLKAFEKTVFHAALDAREHRPWARKSHDQNPERWWSTQGRHLEVALWLTGLATSLADGVRRQISEILGVTEFLLKEARKESSGYRAKGQGVCQILRKVRGGRACGLRLLLCGYVVGKWGRPWSWNTRHRCYEKLEFDLGRATAPT